MHRLHSELLDLIKNDPSVFEFIENSSLDGMWYWDLEDPAHEWMSPKFWTTLGYDYSKRKHLAAEWQELINAEDLSKAISNFEQHCADPNHPYDQLVRYKHQNGSTVWIRCRGKAIRDKDGKPTRMLGAHVDVTKEKEKEIELEKTLQVRNRFFARMSHEIRTPLHGMIGLAENLSAQNTDESSQKMLNTMLSCGEQLQRLLDDLLTVSKINENKFSVSKENVSLKYVIEHCVDLFKAKAKANGLDLAVIPAQLPDLEVVTDQTRIIQILSNLIGNAIKFTEVGSVTINATADANNVSIKISDTGVGIKNVDTIFEAYTQEENPDTLNSGTGLGLAIVSKLCGALGHELDIKSEIGIGTAIELKISDFTHSTLDNKQKQNEYFVEKEPQFESVLIVDDNEINRLIIENMLSGNTDQISHAENGLEALNKTGEGGGYSVILMDLNMPVMDGFAASQAIKEISNPEKQNIIIAVTADTDEMARQKIDAAGIDYYLPKPFTRSQLISVLKSVR